jgi:putative hydrolase of the HAD superfamily
MLANISELQRPRRWNAVAFDLDDTLFDRRAALVRLFSGWLGDEASDEIMQEVIMKDGFGHSARKPFFEWIAWRFPCVADTPELVSRRFRRDFPLNVEVDEGSAKLLADLRRHGIPLGILSNGTVAMQWAKLRASGLVDYFEEARVLISGALGFAKPDPRAFEALLSALDVEKEDLLYVGDDPLRDIQGARKAGLSTCRLRRPGRSSMETGDADLVIDSLAELSTMLGIE